MKPWMAIAFVIATGLLQPALAQQPLSVKPVVEKMFEFHLNLKLKDVNFKELTYDLADVMYDYPFRLPSNFTYIMRALMTLEGIGIITDPEFNFFETAKPYAKEFMLRREGADFRKQFVGKLLGRDEGGKIDWTAEGRPPGILGRAGWTKNSLKPGDVVTVHCSPAKDGTPFCLVARVTLADGTVLANAPPPQS